MKKILVTGAAGFIGSSLVDRLLGLGNSVVGIDNFNSYYDPKIKEANIARALKSGSFKLYKEDILDFDKIQKIFKAEKVDTVVHLAARAGVRPSIEDPVLYTRVNVLGTCIVLKLSAENKVSRIIFGSSSSVYGNSQRIPFEEDDNCENIISPYGSSKRSAEFMVESFCRSYGLKAVILRFFTVYGPRSRVDMAPALFTNAILGGESINKFGSGESSRDYTYVDDIVDGIVKAIECNLDFEIINLGNSNPISLNEFIQTLETLLGREANIIKTPQQIGDVEKTWANVVKARELLGWVPKVKLREGLRKYIEWLKNQS